VPGTGLTRRTVPNGKETPPSGHQGRFGGNGKITVFFEHELDEYMWGLVYGERTPAPPPEHPRFLRMAEVCRRTGLSRVSIKRRERLDPKFPKSRNLGYAGGKPQWPAAGG
jgi:predicted DNA-binding transcriptional regulator AlpA